MILIMTDNKRLAKQFIYGIGYLAVFFAFVFIIYFIWLKPMPTCFDGRQNQSETGIDCGGPCSLACEIKTLSPLDASWIKHFSADNQIVIAAEIKNSNLNWAADSFSYTLDIYGTGNVKLKTLTKNSFIYAKEIKDIIETANVAPKDVVDIKISFSNVSWKSAEEFSKPNVQIRESKTESVGQDGAGITVSGFIANNNAFLLSKVRVIGFLFNQSGVQISASKTEMENIKAFEEKSFKINFPKNISLAGSQLQATSSDFVRNLTQADPSKTKIYIEAIR